MVLSGPAARSTQGDEAKVKPLVTLHGARVWSSIDSNRKLMSIVLNTSARRAPSLAPQFGHGREVPRSFVLLYEPHTKMSGMKSIIVQAAVSIFLVCNLYLSCIQVVVNVH